MKFAGHWNKADISIQEGWLQFAGIATKSISVFTRMAAW